MRKPEATARTRESSSWITFRLGLLTQDAEFETNNKEMGDKKKGREKKREEGKRREQARKVEERLFCIWQHLTGSAKGAKGKYCSI